MTNILRKKVRSHLAIRLNVHILDISPSIEFDQVVVLVRYDRSSTKTFSFLLSFKAFLKITALFNIFYFVVHHFFYLFTSVYFRQCRLISIGISSFFKATYRFIKVSFKFKYIFM